MNANTNNKIHRHTLLICCAIVLFSSMVLAQDIPNTNTTTITNVLAQPATPESIVNQVEQTLLSNMQAGNLDSKARQQRLKPIIDQSFNFPRMGRFLFGSRWKDFNSDQQQTFIQTFGELTTATYAARFNQFNNERFIAVDTTQPRPNRAQVRHALITGKGERIAFDYLLLKENDEWRIVNITTRGVSDLALKRSQYSKLFNDGGLDAVIRYIDEQKQRLTDS